MRVSRKAERRMAAYQQDLMEKHCEEVENMYRQTRGWRHDYRNHIQTMKAYLSMGRYEELAEYLWDVGHNGVMLVEKPQVSAGEEGYED